MEQLFRTEKLTLDFYQKSRVSCFSDIEFKNSKYFIVYSCLLCN